MSHDLRYVLYDQGDLKGACVAFERVLTFPRLSLILITMGVLLRELGDLPAVCVAFRAIWSSLMSCCWPIA